MPAGGAAGQGRGAHGGRLVTMAMEAPQRQQRLWDTRVLGGSGPEAPFNAVTSTEPCQELVASRCV